MAHPRMDHPQCLFEALITCFLVVVVGLHVELCDIIHHLQHNNKLENKEMTVAFSFSLKLTKITSLCSDF